MTNWRPDGAVYVEPLLAGQVTVVDEAGADEVVLVLVTSVMEVVLAGAGVEDELVTGFDEFGVQRCVHFTFALCSCHESRVRNSQKDVPLTAYARRKSLKVRLSFQR